MLKVIPLGGLGEIGLNTMVLEQSGERILVDCGLMFPRQNQPGVEIILPDFTFLRDAPEGLKGVVLTHAHEDHLGALPYLLRELNVPVYGTPFTLALAKHRLDEAGLTAEWREIEPRVEFSIGESFRIEPVRVAHSVPDAVGLAVRTPTTTLVHTGDFKLDGLPVDGQLTDLERLGALGDEGVDVLLSDSTNSEVLGSTASESVVQECFARLLAGAKGRVFISLFGSHLHRVQHALQLARRFSRRAALVGRSLQRNFELARSVGFLEPFVDVVIPVEALADVPPERVLVLCTGAQAEPRAALTSMLSPEPGALRIGPGDLVVLSSRTIPGNETEVSELINRILARGAQVVYPGIEPGVHVSGHGARAEQRRMIEAVRPRQFVPIHGELRHLHQHLSVAREAGMDPRRLCLMSDGDIVGFEPTHATKLGRAPVGRIHTRREALGSVSEATLAERRSLGNSGIVIVSVVMQLGSGKILAGPLAFSQGLPDDERAALPLAAEGAALNLRELSEAMRGDDERVREELVRGVRRVFKQLFGCRPVVTPTVVRI
jgi:ribonuclease J